MQLIDSKPNPLISRAFLLLAFISPMAGATTWIPESAEHYYSSAATVARVRVTKAELISGKYQDQEFECGERVEAEVVDAFKGNAKKVNFVIEGMPLAVGSEYLVFVEPGTDRTEPPIASTNGHALRREELSGLACSEYRREDFVSWLTTSRFIRHWSNSSKSVEDWITPAYNIAVPGDSGALFQHVQLRSLKVDGKVVESDYWSWSGDTVFPDEFWMYSGAFEWASYRKYLVRSFESVEPGKSKDPSHDGTETYP